MSVDQHNAEMKRIDNYLSFCFVVFMLISATLGTLYLFNMDETTEFLRRHMSVELAGIISTLLLLFSGWAVWSTMTFPLQIITFKIYTGGPPSSRPKYWKTITNNQFYELEELFTFRDLLGRSASCFEAVALLSFFGVYLFVLGSFLYFVYLGYTGQY